MSASADFNNPLRKFKLVFLGEQSGKSDREPVEKKQSQLNSVRLACGVFRCDARALRAVERLASAFCFSNGGHLLESCTFSQWGRRR